MADPRSPDQTAEPPTPPAAPPAGGAVVARRFAVAVAAVAAATLLMFALHALTGVERGRVPFIFYFPAVLVAARYGGRAPGLAAVLLSALFANYFFLPPFASLVLDREGMLQTTVFVLVAAMIVVLAESSRRAEAAALASERSLATTLHSIGDAVIATDAAGSVALMNPVAERLTGWTTAEARGRPLAEVFRIVNEETRLTVESPVEKVLREGTVVGLANHTVLLSRSGTETPIDDSGAPIKDEAGRVVGVVLVFHDITERRLTEKRLYARERELTDFVENATVGMHWVGADGKILWANRAELEMLGYTAEEYVGHHIGEFHADPEAIRDILTRLSGDEQLHEYAARLRHKDGSVRHVLINSNVLRDAEGNFTHTRCFTRDITERKVAEEVSTRLAAIVESSDDAIIGKTLAGVITDWNPAAERLYGYTAAEMIGRHISRIVPPELSGELDEILRRLASGQPVEHLETVRVRKDGTRINVSITVSPIRDSAGSTVGASTIARDITARIEAERAVRESEERFRTLADSSPVLIWVNGLEGCEFVNKSYTEFLGRSFDDVLCMDWTAALHPDDAEGYVAAYLDAFGRRERFEAQFRFRRADGEYRWLKSVGVPRFTPDGAFHGYVGSSFDITDLKLSEQAIRESEARVERERLRLRELVGSVPGVVWEAWGVPDESGQRIDFVSDYVETMLGYTVEEWLSTPNFWLNIVHEEDRERAAREAHAIYEGGAGGASEFRWVAKDGRVVPVEAQSVVVRDERGHPVGMRGVTLDITSRKEAEAALHARDERFRALIENSSDAIALFNTDGAIIYASPSTPHVLGYTGEELESFNAFDLIHRDDHAFVAERMRLSIERPRAGVSVHSRVRHKDGTWRFLEGTFTNLLDEPSVGAVVNNYRDATVRHRAEEELRASEERYRALADAMPQIVWTARPDGFFDYYNERWFDYTGMTLEQTRGWGWQPVVHPEDLERTLRRWAISVETGAEYRIEYRLRRADGEYRWHVGRAEPLRDADGSVLKWFGLCMDIHDQKQTEERVRFLAEANALLASSLDYETTLARLARLAVVTLADHCLIDVVGDDGRARRVATAHRDPSKEAVVRDLRGFPPAAGETEGIPSALGTGRPVLVSELTDEKLAALARGPAHLAALRRLAPTSFMVVPLNARDRTLGAITLGLDSSGRRYTATDLSFAEELARRAALAIDNARLYSRAQEANRAKDEFLATLSHELRTPLTPVIGWTHMIRSGQLDDEGVAYGMGVIDKNSQALLRLISDLLDMTSIMSGKMRIEHAPVELEGVLREAVETVRPQADAVGVALEVMGGALPAPEGDGDGPAAAGAGSDGDGKKTGQALVSGDRTRLVQVFWNLLTNAVKFSRKGAAVRVVCRAEDGAARVDVLDEGRGIEPEFLPHVFERFRQADGSTTRAYGGLGLGLALVRSFVEAHGGTAEAFSEGPGRGSRFTVTLPLVNATDDGTKDGATVDEVTAVTTNVPQRSPHDPSPSSDVSPSPSEVPPVQSTSPSSAVAPPRVLVVEDARDTLEMLRVVIGMRGYEAVCCDGAEEALRVAASARFDIIVSDIGLPRVDGYELIRRLRELPHLRETPALALTGYAAAKDAEAALAAGFDAHLPKPVEPSALAEEIERLLGRAARTEDP